jgi:hypothetical protein
MVHRILRGGLCAAVMAAGASVPAVAAAAAGGDQPNTFAAAKSAPASPIGRWLQAALASSHDRDWFRFSLAAPAWSIVTLGDLAGNDQLAIYDARGNPLATSDHGGRHFEQIYRPLPKGDVFVRVMASSASAKAGRYALKVRPMPAWIVFASTHGGFDSTGWHLFGELLNNAADPLHVVRIRVDWFDKSGKRVGGYDGGIRAGPVPPHTRAPFQLARGNDKIPASTRAYEVRVFAKKTQQAVSGGVSLKPGRTQALTDGRRLYRGTITNTTDHVIRNVLPGVVEYDVLGGVSALGFGRTYTLQPRASAHYTMVAGKAHSPAPNGARQTVDIIEPAT